MARMTAPNRSATASRATRTQPNADVAIQVRRALLVCGVVSLIGGVIAGVLEANPGTLSSLFHIDVQPSGVALAAMGLIGLLSGALSGLNLRERTFLLNLLVALVAMLAGCLAFGGGPGVVMGRLLPGCDCQTSSGQHAFKRYEFTSRIQRPCANPS